MPVKFLPDYIVDRKGCVSLWRDPKTGIPFGDDKSMFRCLALFRRRQYVEAENIVESLRESSRAIVHATEVYYTQWCKRKQISPWESHPITITDIHDLELAFDVNIDVWRYVAPPKPRAPLSWEQPMDIEGEGVATDLSEVLVLEREAAAATTCRRKTQWVYTNSERNPNGEVVNVNAYTDDTGAIHFSYIHSIKLFCLNHICETCGWSFDYKSHLLRHQRSRKGECNKQEHLFPGNGAVVSPTLFERLDDVGITVDDKRRYFPYSAVFDCETCCDSSTNRALPLAPFSNQVNFEKLPLDPETVPSDISGVLRPNWHRLRTHIAPDFTFCVIRSPVKLPILRSFARYLAHHQTKWFDLSIKVLKCNRWAITESEIGLWKNIRNEADFEEADLQLFSRTSLTGLLQKALAVRVEITESQLPIPSKSELHLLSVAIASNVPNHKTPAFICRTKDDDPECGLVHDFADELHRIQSTSEELMLRTFQPEFDELDSRLEQLRLRTLMVFADRLEFLDGEICRFESDLSEGKLELLLEGLQNGDDGPPAKRQAIAEMEPTLRNLQQLSRVVMQFQDAYVSCEKLEKFRVKHQWYAAMEPKAMSDFRYYHNERKQLARLRRDLTQYCSILPVLGFNSGRFDLNVMRQWLFPYLQDQQDTPLRPLKRGGKYLQVTTERLRFLDISNYLAPCTTYEKWIRAYTKGCAKGILCYDYIKRPSVLMETQLPPREAFDSNLKGTKCSESEYAEIQRIWQENGMQTLYDYLRYYNLLDVEPFVLALEKMLELWRLEKHDMLNNVCTLPGLADRFVRKNYLPKHTNLVLPQRIVKKDKATCEIDNSDLYYTLKRSIVGGPACVYHRLHIAGETKLRGGPEMCRSIVGLDCNGLYLDSAQKEMPTQVPVRYWKSKPTDEFFQRRSLYPNWQSQTQWLEWKAHELSANIRHQFNSEKPLRIGGQWPDSYDAATKTVFYLDGCRFHGHGGCVANPNFKFPADLDPFKKRQKDFAIRQCLRERGYNVVEIKECEWIQLKRDNPRASQTNSQFVAPKRLGKDFRPPKGNAATEYDYDPTLREFLNEHFSLPKHGRMTESDMLDEIRRGRFFGLIVCDIQVPEHLRDHFADFEPIFKNVEVGPEHLDPHMKEHLKRSGKGSKPRRMLVNSFFATDFVLTTPLAHWYLEHGLEIRNIREAWEWKPKAIYEKFADTVSFHRRRADENKEQYGILGDEWKLRGNSIYGKTLTTVEKHTDTRICSGHKCALAQRNPMKFVKAETFEDSVDWVEVTERKAKVTHNLFTAFGAFVYQYSKLRMLQMYYDCIDYYWDRDDFQLMYVDTDSFYFALSTTDLKSFKQKVRTDRAAEFALDWNNYLAFDENEATNPMEQKWAAFDKRKVGLFKVEAIADRMCALAPKSYGCANNIPKKGIRLGKFSAKGVPRAQNELTWASFYNVLQTQRPLDGQSITLTRPRNSQRICQIQAPKRLLTYDFYKRKLSDDGITTSPLGL